MAERVRTGLENCLESPPPEMCDARLGLLMNQASVDHQYRYACDLLAQRFPGRLKSLFSPQHGLWGEQQANMIESPDTRYAPLDLPVYSLYSETRRPTEAILQDIDCLVIDLQDVGTRVYTFIWTMLECLRACADNDVRVVVLDRPNPLGGDVIEGPMLERQFRSFVGGFEIPLRHGLTIGELARLFNTEERIDAELTVVPMSSWKRQMLFSDTGLPWVPPSPNMPRFETAILYPGQVLLEGTNLSEGRGTTMPFECIGAPYLNAQTLVDLHRPQEHAGIAMQPIRFCPAFDKWQGKSCEGMAIHILDPRAVRSVALTLSIIDAVRQLIPQHFAWLLPPYEYEYEKPPIDILYGSSDLRLQEYAKPTFDAAAWQRRTADYRMYA